MLGLWKKDDFARAVEVFERDTGIKLDTIPDKRPVRDLFKKISAQGALAHEAQIALLYRLVVMNFFLQRASS
jgi:hypothetical protein